MRTRMPILTCLLTLSTVVVAFAAAAEAAPGGFGFGPLPVPTTAGTPAPLVSSPATRVPGGADRATVRTRLAAYAAAGITSIGCVTAAPAKPTDGPAAALAGAAAGGTWCDGLAGEQWYADRSSACLHAHAVTYKVIETPSGTVSGTAEFRVAQEIALSASSTEMDESASVKLVASTGKLAVPKATFSAHCTNTCVTADGSGLTNETFTVNETQDAFFTYTDTPHRTAHTFDLGYTFTVTPPPGTKPLITMLTWAGPTDIRCDDQVGGSPGCVFPGYQPALDLPVATFGAGAMTVLFAQVYLPDAWGYTKPLHREANDGKAAANRAAICDSTWIPDPTVATDSCDEYAFAATKESGGNLGLRGSDCAEVKITKDPSGKWVPTAYKYTGTERCVRAHVPTSENTAVGGELGRFTVANRLLDNDGYTVNVH
jgi:hypothetical protein